MVVKRSGRHQPFERGKIAAGVAAAAKNRPVTALQIDTLVAEVEESLRAAGSEVASERIGLEVLERLARLDEVAYLRFASVYKGFEGPVDFQRELGLLPGRSLAEPPGREVVTASSLTTGSGATP